MLKRIMMMATVAMLTGALYACGSRSGSESTSSQPAETAAPADESRAIKEGLVKLADDNAIRPGKAVAYPTVLDFNATWCVPCRKLTPAMEAAAQKYQGKIEVYAVDIDANPETAKAFNVQSVPTVVLITPDGKTQTHVGLQDFQGELPADATPEQQQEAIQAGLFSMIDGLIQ